MTATNNKLVPNKRFPEFENSGDWEEKKLEDIGNFYRGHSYSKEDVSTEDKANTIVLRSNNIDEYRINYNDLQYVTKKCRKEIIVKNNDIIICMSNGSANLVGKNAYIRYDKIPHDKKIDDKDITVGAFCGIYRTENQIVKYFFQSDFYKKQLQTLFAGSNINNLKGTDILSMYIYTPPSHKEQNRIADFLSTFDELIELEQKKLDKLKEYKKGLLQNIFESNGQDKCVIDRFNCSSDILKNLSVIIMGASPAKEKANTETGIEFHQGKSFFDYLYINDSKKYTTDYSKQINKDYIIMSVRAPVGEINLTDREIALGRGLCGIKPVKINKLYLYYYLLYFKNLINYNAKGLVFDSITKSDVENINIKFPPDTIQENIGNTLFSIDKIIMEQINKVKKLQEYKKGLLQQLFPN